jgi:hypothetical protein
MRRFRQSAVVGFRVGVNLERKAIAAAPNNEIDRFDRARLRREREKAIRDRLARLANLDADANGQRFTSGGEPKIERCRDEHDYAFKRATIAAAVRCHVQFSAIAAASLSAVAITRS